jgi:hypothetical protein
MGALIALRKKEVSLFLMEAEALLAAAPIGYRNGLPEEAIGYWLLAIG